MAAVELGDCRRRGEHAEHGGIDGGDVLQVDHDAQVALTVDEVRQHRAENGRPLEVEVAVDGHDDGIELANDREPEVATRDLGALVR